MEAEQRPGRRSRAAAEACIQPRRLLGLLIAEIGGQQRSVCPVEATITCPGVTCRASWRLSCAARRIASSE